MHIVMRLQLLGHDGWYMVALMTGLDRLGNPEDLTPDEVAQVGQNVRALRQALGWTQSDLARRMVEEGARSWSQTTVSRVENGRQGITFRDGIALEDALSIDVWNGTSCAWPPGAERAERKPRLNAVQLVEVREAHAAVRRADGMLHRLRLEMDPGYREEE